METFEEFDSSVRGLLERVRPILEQYSDDLVAAMAMGLIATYCRAYEKDPNEVTGVLKEMMEQVGASDSIN